MNPSFRATPWRAEKRENSNRSGVRIVFVSESNICRSPLAAGLLQQLLKDNSLEGEVEIASRVRKFLQGFQCCTSPLSDSGLMLKCEP